jgi:hypothetical protein
MSKMNWNKPIFRKRPPRTDRVGKFTRSLFGTKKKPGFCRLCNKYHILKEERITKWNGKWVSYACYLGLRSRQAPTKSLETGQANERQQPTKSA